MAHAHEICSTLRALLMLRLEPLGIDVVTMARATWSHRVVPFTKGGITDAMVNAALPSFIASGSDLLLNQDQRDAAGLLVGHILTPQPKQPRAPRAPAPVKAKPARPAKPKRELTEDEIVDRRLRWKLQKRAYLGIDPERKKAAVATAIAHGSWLR
jgi:hypothetical protein